MSWSATDVKSLREKTGAGMMDCKKALTEAAGDMGKAVEVLRKQGLSIAAKKSGRSARDGTIGHWLSDDSSTGALVEINCETDFVAKNDDFQKFVSSITTAVAKKNPQDVDALMKLPIDGRTVSDAHTAAVAKIGENISIRRFNRMNVNGNGRLAQYIHAGNKIGVMILFSDPNGKLDETTAREIAMHVAAMNPRFLNRREVAKETLEKEKEILLAQMKDEKKPPEILEKIVLGKLNKFYAETCLEEQVYVRDPEGKRSVSKILNDIDPKIKLEQFVRFQVGEGLE